MGQTLKIRKIFDMEKLIGSKDQLIDDEVEFVIDKPIWYDDINK